MARPAPTASLFLSGAIPLVGGLLVRELSRSNSHARSDAITWIDDEAITNGEKPVARGMAYAKVRPPAHYVRIDQDQCEIHRGA